MGEHNGYLPFPKGFATDAIHFAQEPETFDSMSITVPIITSTTFKQAGPDNFQKFQYGRANNPTTYVLEQLLAKLDDAKQALVFASGMGAEATILSLLKSGDHLICGKDIYGGTIRLFEKVGIPNGIEVSFVDCTDITNLETSIRKNTKLVFIESPTNPMMQVTDIKAVSEIAKKNNMIFAIDNTFLTPYLQKPLNLGADIVCYSLTKYMNGHSDVVMGSLALSDSNLYEKLRFYRGVSGNVPGPFDCYQVIRGLKTLALRMQQHNENALLCAKYLENHPKVEKVLHPGLSSHPQNDLSKKQTCGNSGVFSFYLKGNQEASKKFIGALKLFAFAGSLGGYESLIAIPALMSHRSVPPEDQAKLGITDTLIRLSVGIENSEDLIADLEQALETA